MNIEQALKRAKTPYLDSEVLLAFTLNKPRELLISHSEKELTKSQEKKFKSYVSRRLKGEPVAYIRGFKEFFDLDFIVNKDVLIPRPDTELIVDVILRYDFASQNHSGSLRILDIGTGSGCIPITLKKHLSKAEIIGTDISDKALAVARRNAKKHKTDIRFYKSDLLKKLPKNLKGKINIITFNPPYLTKNEARKKELAFEPQVALTPDNFKELIRDFFKQAKEYLADKGVIFMEIGHRQAKITSKIAKEIFPDSKIEVIKDLGGFDRVIQIQSYRS